MKYLKLGIAPLCSLWFSYLSLANWLARYPVSRGEAGVCRFGGTHWLFDPTSPGVSPSFRLFLSLSLVSLFRMYIHAYIYNFFLSDLGCLVLSINLVHCGNEFRNSDLGWWVGCSFHQWCFQCSDNVLCQLASPFKFEKLGAD